MGVAIGVLLKQDEMLIAIEKSGAALGCGLGLAGLMVIFIAIAICLFVKANRCLAVLVSLKYYRNSLI